MNNFYEILHEKGKGWICRVKNRQSEFKQYYYKYSDLLKQELNGENIFILLNTFYRTYRRIEFIKELNANYIDLDIYKTGFIKEQILINGFRRKSF